MNSTFRRVIAAFSLLALVSVIAEQSATPDLIARVEDYVQWLRGASARNVHA